MTIGAFIQWLFVIGLTMYQSTTQQPITAAPHLHQVPRHMQY